MASAFVSGGRRVILQTRLSPDNARSLLTESLMESGYASLVPYQPGTGEQGFVYRDRMPAPPGNQLCHETYGNMTIDTMPGQNRLLVALTASGPGSFNASQCEQLRAQYAAQENRPGAGVGIDRYMPKLELPEEASVLSSSQVPLISIAYGAKRVSDRSHHRSGLAYR